MFLDRAPKSYGPEERQNRADRVRGVISDPIFAEAVEDAEYAAIREALLNPDPDARERARMMFGAIQSLSASLQGIADDAPPR